MLIATSTLLIMLGVLGPWVLVSHITRQECQGSTCRPFAGQTVPQVHQVQTFGTAEECLKVREQMMHQVDEALAPVNQLVEARNPALSIRMSTTFLCLPETGTTGEH
jgi:hypothetical protein